MSGSRRPPAATVVLSAYNGARHIAEQIESIREQTFREWTLIVRDDGSSDATIAIVRALAADDPRIELVEDTRGTLGPSASFSALMERAYADGAEYVFLCDQDDVWLPGKMEQLLSALEAKAARNRGADPLLAHTDLQIVDEALRLIHSSFSEFQHMSYSHDDPLRTLLIHNAVVGCSAAVNRALLEFALPIPAGSPHDWWLALCAAATGAIVRGDAPMVLYRQHATNVIGAVPPHAFVADLVRNPASFIASSFRAFGVGVDQACELRERMTLRGLGDSAAFARIDSYCDAFAEGETLTGRLRALRNSSARPQRGVSRVIVYGLAAVFPRARSRIGK